MKVPPDKNVATALLFIQLGLMMAPVISRHGFSPKIPPDRIIS
jgi:hypothetical protein